jgi:hypothetical protein
MLPVWYRAATLAVIVGATGGAIFLYHASTLSPRTRTRTAGALSLVSGTAGGLLLLYYARNYASVGTENAYTWLGIISLVSAVLSCALWLWVPRWLDRRRGPPPRSRS